MLRRKAIQYGEIIPGSAFIRSLVIQGTITKTAAGRLKWLDFHRSCGNIRLTCRHFNISPTTLHKWLGRFDPYGLTTLEDESRRPQHVRQSQTPAGVVERVRTLREQHPRWGKEKLAVLLSREGAGSADRRTGG